MRKFLALAIILALLSPSVNAREVNNGNLDNNGTPDAACWNGGAGYSATAVTGGISGGVNGAEDCVDFSGNFLPTVNNAQTLGTSALTWQTIYSVNQVNTGNQTQGTPGTAPLSGLGNSSSPTTESILGAFDLGETAGIGTSVWGINSSTSIPVISPFEVLMSSSPSLGVFITATPSIATRAVAGTGAIFPSGFILVLTSTVTAGVTLQDAGTLSGSQLALGAATRVISKTKTLTLIWEANIARWLEIAYGNNQGN